MSPSHTSGRRWARRIGVALLAAIAAYAVAIAAGLEDEAWVENHVEIARPVDQVFAFIGDQRHELDWNPDAQQMKKLTDGPIGVGTRYAAKWKQSPPVEVTVTRFEPPRAYTAENGGDLAVTVQVTLEPHGTGTLLTSRFTARPHGFMKVAFPVFKLMMADFEKANMSRIKTSLEK